MLHFLQTSLQLLNYFKIGITFSFLFILNSEISAQTLEWAKSFGGAYSDFGLSIASDHLGNVYTTGNFDETTDFDPGPNEYILNANGNNDIFIQKLDAQGNLVWVKTYGGNRGESGNALTVDEIGNIYITGYFTGTINFDPPSTTYEFTEEGNGNIFILKLDSDGNTLWARAMGGLKGDSGYAIAVDTSSNVYITGWFDETVDFDPGPDSFLLTSNGKRDIYIQKMGKDGNFLWAKSFGGVENDFGYGIQVDPFGNIFATGNFLATVDFDPGAGQTNITCTGQDDSYILKLDTDGNFLWVKTMEGSAGVYTLAINTDESGNVITTGSYRETADFNPGIETDFHTSAGLNDIFIQKLDANGDLLWAQSYGNTGRDVGFYSANDDEGNVYTTGAFSETVDFDPSEAVANLTSAGESDIFIQKLDANGAFLWAYSFGGSGLEDGYSINVDKNRNIYLLAAFQETASFTIGEPSNTLVTNGYDDVAVVKLSQSISGLSEESNVLFLTAYPNPTSEEVNIAFAKPISSANVEITDVQGKVIMKKQITNVSHDTIELIGNSGIYFVIIKTPESSAIIKVIKE